MTTLLIGAAHGTSIRAAAWLYIGSGLSNGNIMLLIHAQTPRA
ncbi:hypothetical protein [Sphingomonas qilianensis]